MRDGVVVTGHETLGTLSRECAYGVRAEDAIHVVQGRDGQIVVVVVERVTSRIGKREDTCGPSSPRQRRRTEGSLIIGLHEAFRHERVEMPSNHCRCVPHPQRKLCGGRWSAVEQRACDALRGRAGEFHTLIVSQIPWSATSGSRRTPLSG